MSILQINPQKPSQIVVVMVPLPAQGHLNQLLHLSRMILSYGIPVHFVSTAAHNRQARRRVQGWDPKGSSSMHFHDFEIPEYACPPSNPDAKNKFPSQLVPCFKASTHLQEPVSVFLRSLSKKSRKVIVIHDSLMASVVQEVGVIPNAESYCFHSVSAFTMCLFYWEKMGKPIDPNNPHIPNQIPSLDGCFTDEFLDFIASQYEFNKLSSGCIYNTSRLLEHGYMELIEQQYKHANSKHFALGPFNPVSIEGITRKHFCLEWLDKQATNSVIYVCFGTTTAMENEQIKELGNGLKQSNQKFIWVLREADKGVEEQENQEMGNNKISKMGKGIIVKDQWVPQLEILGHRATGGFMSHCGWNSCMESISMGVPIAAWPMHSDQPRNATLMTQCLNIAILLKPWETTHQIVSSDIIQNCVSRLMSSDEGDQIRKRAAQLGQSLRHSMAQGGSSRIEFDSFITHICT